MAQIIVNHKLKNILNMKEWHEEKFQKLLKPNIWHSNYQNIKNIFGMKEWQEEKFQKLLTSNIWSSNYEEIHSHKHRSRNFLI